MFLHISDFKIMGDYKLKIMFDNNQEVEIDLQNELEGEIFEPLRDINFFNQVFLNKDTLTIEWPNGADFAPEYLYELGKKKELKIA